MSIQPQNILKNQYPISILEKAYITVLLNPFVLTDKICLNQYPIIDLRNDSQAEIVLSSNTFATSFGHFQQKYRVKMTTN